MYGFLTKKRVCFVGDWLRISVNAQIVSVIQKGNIDWISHLLAPALRELGIEFNIIMPPSDLESFAKQFNDSDILQEFYENPSETWAKMYEHGPGPHCFYEMFESVSFSDLIIGFEIPPFMKKIFKERGLEYISLHLHPIRFLKDFTFSAYTNSPIIAKSLRNISCNPQSISHQVSRFSARLARIRPIQAHIPEGIPIILGQTGVDSSLIAQGRFMRLQDYSESLSTILDGHGEVAFLKHPLSQWREQDIKFLTNDMRKTVIGISGNSYLHIISPERLGPVVSISSSLGVEARLFKRDSHFLLSDPRNKFAVPELDDPQRVQLDHRLFEPAFWQNIIEHTGQGIPNRSDSFHLGADYIRGTLQDSSLKGLEGADALPPTEKMIIPAPGITPARLDELASCLSGTGLNDRQRMISHARDQGIDLKLASEPLAPGRIWTWGSGGALPELYISGFHPVEDHGAWSRDQLCTITIPLDDPADLELECEADISFFSGILSHNPALLIYINGKPVSALFQLGKSTRDHRLTWTMQLKESDVCVIQIECSHYARPCDLDGSDDQRCLGFMLHRLAVKASTPARA